MINKKGIIQKLEKEKIKQRGVKKIGLFGSYSRGEQNKNSDVDILVKINDSEGLFKLIRLKRKLETALNKKVDLIEYEYLHPLIKKQALKEEVRII